ncbi:hypothetical protein ACQ4PT_006917 [Festuca glaucescens]
MAKDGEHAKKGVAEHGVFPPAAGGGRALEESPNALGKAASAVAVPRKQRLKGEPSLTKKVPLGDDPAHLLTTGNQLPVEQEVELVLFLQKNADVFAWDPSDLPGVPREIIEHHLAVCPDAQPVRQKVRRQAQDRQDFIVKEVRKLAKAGVVWEVLHPTWTANPVVVPKPNLKMRLCIDFTDLN